MRAPSSLELQVTSTADLAMLEELFHRGAHAQSEALARELLSIDPQLPFAAKVLAASVAARGALAEAITLYRNAPVTLQEDWQFHNNFGNTLKAAGQRDEAAVHYRRAIALHGSSIEPFYNLGVTMIETGNLHEAERWLRHVLRVDPAHGLTHTNLGNILNAHGHLRQAEMHYQCAMLTMSADARLLNNYGQLLNKLHRFAQAEAFYRESITRDECFPHPYVNLAELVAGHGLVEEAETLLRHALSLDANLAKAHSNLLFVMALRDTCQPTALLAEHMAFAARFEAPLKVHWPQHTNTREPERTLRVGFVSGDLSDHPIARYLLPALRQLARHADLDLYAYSSGMKNDAYTVQYRALMCHWHDTALMPDDELARLIMADRIDVLIDLSGHSGDNRLLTFARRPAPVQVSWMGYVGTTGLEAMDYFAGDEHLTPSSMRAQFREKILYLPATTTFQPHEPAIAPNVLPVLASGVFTFCCLARINKLNRSTVVWWSRILHGAPTSRMMLAALPGGTEPERVRAWFAEQGIGADRLVFTHARTVEEQLRLHHQADLCLDTFPYNGATTISHALCMGVPTLTQRGTLPGSMLGASINAHVGIPDLIAADAEDYVRKAIAFTHDLPALASLRRELPGQFASSALQQHEFVTDTLVSRLRAAWRRWCHGLPPDHLR
ncbi:tetratricopeptide repeat protein [Terriglobus roseus]|uniref:protein O-GlcNAc transferase n=1 Tax=Terriglobus roseus TaxID=392734 RepID=A0A1H4NQN4_9BACT|nr:glycosyltransferase family 41 protein [Terriglobus roseus]SEB97576.1 Predicted O-linked N-acetylglucosamine transferase, SPINDLY family [Terriglobus roseus]